MANDLKDSVNASKGAIEVNAIPKSGPDVRASSKDSKKPYKTLDELIKRFAFLSEAERTWRGKKREWEDFYDGNQLSDEEIEELNSRAQPPVVINKIAPRLDLIVGINQSNRFRLKAFPRNVSDQDIATADAISQALRYIDENNDQKYKESEVFEDGAKSGRGWFEVTTDFTDDFDIDIRIKGRSSDDIYLDHTSCDYDLKDARDLADSVFVHREDLKEIFPDKAKEIDQAMSQSISYFKGKTFSGDDYLENIEKLDNLFFDKGQDRVRVVKYWFKRKEMRSFLVSKVGVDRLPRNISKKERQKAFKKVQKLDPEAVILERTMDVVYVQTFIANTILEEKEPEFLGGKFPYIPFFVKREKKTNVPYGLIKPMMDPQKEINKRRSKALHALNTERIIYEEGAVMNEDKLREEVARPDGVIKKNRGFDLKIESNREVGTTQLNFYQAANGEIDEVTGSTPDLLGSVTNARSAAAIQTRQRQGLAVLNRMFENWKRTRIMLEEMKLLFMQEFWTEQKVIRVTDDQNVIQAIRLNVQVDENMKLNDVSAGKYDIIIEETDESVNLMEETFKELVKLSQTGQIPPDLPIEFAPLPKGVRDRLIARLQEARQQQQAALAQAQAVQAGPEAQGLPPELAQLQPPGGGA